MKFFLKILAVFLIPTIIFAGVFVPKNIAFAADSVAQREAQLREELAKTEAEIAQWTTVLNKKRQETGSIARDAAILAGKIEQAKLVIKAKNLTIQTLGKDISQKEQTITELNNKINRGKESLSELIRKTNEMESYSVAEVAFSNKDISEFFSDVDSYDSIKRSLGDLFADIRQTKNITEAEKVALGVKRNQETDARVAVETEKRAVEKTEAEKQELLRISKSQEKSYEQVLKEKQAQAAQIRSALFALRDTAAIPFGTALLLANKASEKTGVRPALILAILTQESNLGQNVGSCLITDLTSGSTRSTKSGTVFSNGIHPTRDLPVLQSILPALGRDPLNTPVSCPLSIGYGGAMGPAQFIPSTWKVMEAGLAKLLGKKVPDPWEPADAIMAASMLLRDNGATTGSFTNERTAACKYYSGRNCYNDKGLPNVGLTYGTQVMAKAQTIQETMIDPLQGL